MGLIGTSGRATARLAAIAAAVAVVLAAIAVLATRETAAPEAIAPLEIAASASQAPSRAPNRHRAREPAWPAEGAGDEARSIARERGGLVSFAAIGPRGREVTYEAARLYSAASVVKVLLLVAELRRLEREGAPLDEKTAQALRAMITMSDNDAADAIYSRSGDTGLLDVARDAGMRRFTVAGHWGNAQITAADMARFMWNLDELLDLPHGRYGGRLLASIVESQSWGLPAVTPDDARLRFKGGWVPTDDGQIVHQAGSVELDGKRYAIAVLTDAQPSMAHAIETVEAVEWQLLRRDPRPTRGGR